MEYYLAFDTETTGLSEKCNVLTAYFIILDKDLNEIDTLDLYIKHEDYYIQKRAMEINKINLEEHEKIADNVTDATNKIENFIRANCDTEQQVRFVPLGHNVSYDLKMSRSNKLFSSYVEKRLSEHSLDTITIGKELKSLGLIPAKQSLSLGKLTQYLGVTTECEKLHNAEYDIRLTIELLKKMNILKRS